MTFFVTSAGKGNGADLGGLNGADAHCQALAKAAGSTLTNWRAYLSTQAVGGAQSVNARDRIGRGPWQNAKGEVIAKSVDDLHSPNNKISKQTQPQRMRRRDRQIGAAQQNGAVANAYRNYERYHLRMARA